jgi:hypothetical protein
MGANIAGIYGAQIFREDDSPRYRRGFSVNIAVLTVGLLMAVIRFVDDLLRRRRTARQIQHEPESDHDSHNEDKHTAALHSDFQPETVLIGDELKPTSIVSNTAK